MGTLRVAHKHNLAIRAIRYIVFNELCHRSYSLTLRAQIVGECGRINNGDRVRAWDTLNDLVCNCADDALARSLGACASNDNMDTACTRLACANVDGPREATSSDK